VTSIAKKKKKTIGRRALYQGKAVDFWRAERLFSRSASVSTGDAFSKKPAEGLFPSLDQKRPADGDEG